MSVSHDSKDVRHPEAMVTGLKFKEPLPVYKTDYIEIDMAFRKARVVNSKGKVKLSVSFTVECDGQTTTAGS